MNLMNARLSPDFMEPIERKFELSLALGLLAIALTLLFVISALQLIDKENYALATVSTFFAVVFTMAAVSLFMNGSSIGSQEKQDKNNQVEILLKEKYGAKLTEHAFENGFKITDLTEKEHKILDKDGIHKTVTIELSEDNSDLILSTVSGEIDQLKTISPIN